MDYFISVDDSSLRGHPEFDRLTQMGETVVYASRNKHKHAFYIGMDEEMRHYYFSPEDDLGLAMRVLSDGVSTKFTIQKSSKENLPENLRKMYTRFFEAVGCKT